MSVHLQIKNQMNNFIVAEKKFKQLDLMREQLIEEVIAKANDNKPFSLVEVNKVTEELNSLSKSFRFPTRKDVTKEMVIDFINK